jgi:hypothetical protein
MTQYVDANLASSAIKQKLIDSYGAWVQQHVDGGWEAYLFTLTFQQLFGTTAVKWLQMETELDRFYRRFATRAVRKPRSEV